MTPGNTTVERLRAYLNKQKGGETSYEFSCELKEMQVQLRLKEFDKFSFIVKSVRVSRLDEGHPGTDSLRKQADFLKSNLTYLLENLEVFEIDALQSKAQLRSHIPRDDNTTLSYFEIIIEQQGRIALQRFAFDKQKKQRKSATFQLTDETLERTVNDFVKAIALVQ